MSLGTCILVSTKHTNRMKKLTKKINKNTVLLILGSFPSAISLKERQYYANTHNQFWRIISYVLKKDLIRMSYNKKIEILLQNGIGLWDVLASCDRRGSEDNTIRNAKVNKFNDLFKKFPNIKAIFCNGKEAWKYYVKNVRASADVMCLPSSSSAYPMSLMEKRKKWNAIKKYL